MTFTETVFAKRQGKEIASVLDSARVNGHAVRALVGARMGIAQEIYAA